MANFVRILKNWDAEDVASDVNVLEILYCNKFVVDFSRQKLLLDKVHMCTHELWPRVYDYELTNTKWFHVKLIHKHPIMAESVLGDVIGVFKYITKRTSKCNIVKLKNKSFDIRHVSQKYGITGILNPLRPEWLGRSFLGETKFCLIKWRSNYFIESWDLWPTFDTLINAFRFKA